MAVYRHSDCKFCQYPKWEPLVLTKSNPLYTLAWYVSTIVCVCSITDHYKICWTKNYAKVSPLYGMLVLPSPKNQLTRCHCLAQWASSSPAVAWCACERTLMPSQTERGKFLYAGGLERNMDIMKIGKSVNVHVYILYSNLMGTSRLISYIQQEILQGRKQYRTLWEAFLKGVEPLRKPFFHRSCFPYHLKNNYYY